MNPLKVNEFLNYYEMPSDENEKYKKFLRYFPSGFSTELKKCIDKTFATKGLNFFVCRDKSDKQKSYCIHCKHYVVLPEKHQHNDKYVCPYCGIEGTIKHAWRLSKSLRNTLYMQYYEKADYDKNSIICRGLYIVRYISLKTLHVNYEIETGAYYLFQHNNCKMVRYCGFNWCYTKPLVERKSIHPLWSNYYFTDICADDYESFIKAVQGTKWEHCCYKELCTYLESDFIKLLYFYDKYPQMEYIVKAGFPLVIAEKIRKRPMYGMRINFKAMNLKEAIGLPGLSKLDKKYIKSFKGQIRPEELKIWQMIKKENINCPINKVFERKTLNLPYGYFSIYMKNIIELHKIIPSVLKIHSYVSRQVKLYGERCNLYIDDILRDWLDYLKECKSLGMDLKDTAVTFPKNLRVAHENTTKQIKLKKEKLLKEKIERLSLKRQRYKYSFKNIVSMPAASVDELIAEGAALNHCVGTYADRYAKGETDIVFIRKVSEPDRSFYTMEIKNNQVVQVRGSHNCGMTDEVKEFVEHFKNDVLNKPQKISKKKGSKAA